MNIQKLQVCVLVPDLNEAMERYRKMFNITSYSVYTVDTSQLSGVTYRGKAANYKLRVAMADLGNGMLELLQPQGGESIYQEFLDRFGEGIHHIGLVVDDYAESFQRMLDQGYAHSQGGPIVGTDRVGRFDYFDTAEKMGATFELLDMPNLPRGEMDSAAVLAD